MLMRRVFKFRVYIYIIFRRKPMVLTVGGCQSHPISARMNCFMSSRHISGVNIVWI